MSQQGPSEYGAGSQQPSWGGGNWSAQQPPSPYDQPFNQQPPAAHDAGSGWGGTPNPWPAGGDATPPPYGSPPTVPNAPYPNYPPDGPTYPGYAAPPSQGFPPGYNPYGPYGAPPPPPRKNRVGMIIGIVVGAVLLVCVGGVALLYALGNAVQSQVPAVSATLTASAQVSPTPTVIYQDALNTRSTGWPNDGDCSLQNDGLHVNNGFICFAPTDQLSNVDARVQVKQTSGDTGAPYGIALRRASRGNFYHFVIDSSGDAAIFKCTSTADQCATLVDYTSNSAIHSGLNTSNTLEVRAVGSHFVFSVNGTQVAQMDDTSFSTGLVGLGEGASIHTVFSNLTITQAG